MDYILNNQALLSPAVIPSEVTDKYLKLASGEQLKVLLYFVRNIYSGIEAKDISDYLKIAESEVLDALNFWEQTGILIKTGVTKTTEEKKEKVAVKALSVKPTREEIASLSQTDPMVSFLLREAELKFRRALRGSELQTLVWLYSDYGMDISLILMLVEYAISENRANIGFIESTALNWIETGVDSIASAEKYIEEQSRKKTSWSIVQRLFGLEQRNPTAKELEFCYRWIDEWDFKSDMLKQAYDKCVDAKGKVSFSYINKILEAWHKNGISSPASLNKDTKPSKKKVGGSFSAYDKSLVDKLLNSDD